MKNSLPPTQAKKLKAKSTERIAIFAKKSALAYSVPANRNFGTMNLIGRVLPPVKALVPTFQARILRETETRFYIADIERVGGGAIANGITGHGAIQGYSPNYYIDKEHLFLDNATPEAIAQVVAHYNELHEDYARTCDRIVEEVYPILKRETDRAKQKEAEIEDRLSALLSSLNSEKEC